MFQKNCRILFQGDSITDYGRSREADTPANQGLGSGHPMLIAAELLARFPQSNLQIFNRGFCGDRIVNLYSRWKIDAINLRPDYISILIGANDTWARYTRNDGVEVERFDKIYRMLLDWTLQELPETKFIICEPFLAVYEGASAKEEMWEDMRPRQQAVKQIAADYNAIFVPFQSIFDEACKKAHPSYWFFDGVHPLHAGYGLMTRSWLDTVGKALNTQPA
jgi:lysophospholipase L1-like esterase